MRSKRKLVGLSTEIQPRVDRPCTVDEPTQSRSTLTDPGFASGERGWVSRKGLIIVRCFKTLCPLATDNCATRQRKCE